MKKDLPKKERLPMATEPVLYSPPELPDSLTDQELEAQYKKLRDELKDDIAAWEQSAERAKLTTQKQTISAALGGISFLRRLSNRKNYRLADLCHDPDTLLLALDEYAEACLQLGILPAKESLCMWLHTSIAGFALVRNSPSGQFDPQVIDIIINFENYIISSWVQFSNLKTGAPPFSIFYLKAVFSYSDTVSVNVNVNNARSNAELGYTNQPSRLVGDCAQIDVDVDEN